MSKTKKIGNSEEENVILELGSSQFPYNCYQRIDGFGIYVQDE